jgi:hypothetical protein
MTPRRDALCYRLGCGAAAIDSRRIAMEEELWKQAYRRQFGSDPDQDAEENAEEVEQWRVSWQAGYDAGEDWAISMVAEPEGM